MYRHGFELVFLVVLKITHFLAIRQESMSFFYASVSGNHYLRNLNYINFFELNLNSFLKVWNTLDAQKLIAVSDNNIYVVCLESIDNDSALFLDNALRNGSSYLEAVGVNEASFYVAVQMICRF